MANSHPLRFYHPAVGDHIVYVGMDQIEWGYTLNTSNYPTYGGEVVQILSCMIDDLQVSGTFRTYREMENFYAYFLGYLKSATQGNGPRQAGQTSFNQQPMIFQYPHRGWEFNIIPTEVPGFKYSRDLTVPQWNLTAFIFDPSDDLKDEIISEIEIRDAVGDPSSDANFGLQGKIGLVEPAFSDPFTDRGNKFKFSDTEEIKRLGDYYATIIPSYLQGDFTAIIGNVGSKPAFGSSDIKKGTGTDVVKNTKALKSGKK